MQKNIDQEKTTRGRNGECSKVELRRQGERKMKEREKQRIRGPVW